MQYFRLGHLCCECAVTRPSVYFESSHMLTMKKPMSVRRSVITLGHGYSKLAFKLTSPPIDDNDKSTNIGSPFTLEAIGKDNFQLY